MPAVPDDVTPVWLNSLSTLNVAMHYDTRVLDATTRSCAMDVSDGETRVGTPEESWRDIHETMYRAQSSMYLAGTPTILLLWAGLASLGVGSQYAILLLGGVLAAVLSG